MDSITLLVFQDKDSFMNRTRGGLKFTFSENNYRVGIDTAINLVDAGAIVLVDKGEHYINLNKALSVFERDN